MQEIIVTRLLRWLAIIGMVASLSGCFYPEKFTLDVVFSEDGSVNLTFEGTIFSYDALLQMRHGNRSLTSKEDATMQKVGDVLGKRVEIKSIKYIGDGRYQIKAQRAARRDQLLVDMPIFGVFRDLENNTEAVMQTGSNASDAYQKVNIHPEGVIKITLPDNAKVVSSTTEPSRSMVLFGKRTVTWNYKLGAEAKMRLRF